MHLFNDTLAILSIQNQSVYLYHLSDVGSLERIRVIGYYTHVDDHTLIDELEKEEYRRSLEARPRKKVRFGRSRRPSLRKSGSGEILASTRADTMETPRLSGIKQSLMSFLFKRARDSGESGQMQHFCLFPRLLIYLSVLLFEQFSSLIMWRVHFMDADTLLLKFGTMENITYRIFFLAADIFSCSRSTY